MSKRARELREKSVPELNDLLTTTQNDLVTVRFAVAMRTENNFARLRQLRRDIARIKTLLTEQELYG